MAKLKMLKYPKKPKASASLNTLENWLSKKKEIDRENAHRKSQNAKREKLAKQIAGIGKAGSVRISVSPKRKKKSTSSKKSKSRSKKRK